MKTELSYKAPFVREFDLASYEGFLTGSVTSDPIEPNEVEVKPFVQGFGDENSDFKQIDFD